MWLMKKSRKVVSVSTSMKDECVSLPKPKSQLAQLHDDDEDVFATSVIDRYAARPLALQDICKVHTEAEKYYHAKLFLYYPWNHEDDIISTYQSYQDSYISKQHIIHQNAQKFNKTVWHLT